MNYATACNREISCVLVIPIIPFPCMAEIQFTAVAVEKFNCRFLVVPCTREAEFYHVTKMMSRTNSIELIRAYT